MKTKSRPVKRKSSEDLSMECDKRDISKKHRIASSHIFLDVDTMSTSHDFLQLSPKASTGMLRLLPYPIRTSYLSETIWINMNTITINHVASSNDTKLFAAKDYRNKDETHKYQLTDKSIGRNIGLPIGNNKPEVATRIKDDIVDPYTLQPCDLLGIPAEYNHLGQCTSVCRHCGAMFWECEKVASTSEPAKWPELKEFLEALPTVKTTTERADIFLYTIEFQKRGLPHCHSLLWIDAASRVQQDVDVMKNDPMKLWHKLWKDLSDDIPRKLSKTLRIPQIERNEKKLKASVLFNLEHMLNAYSKSLKDFGLPMPPEDMILILQNRLLMEETNYDQELLLQEKNFLLPRLNKEQRLIFDEITNAIRSNTHRLIFVYGHGGRLGKTFLSGKMSHSSMIRRKKLSSQLQLQTPAVKKKASKPEILDASITSSYLWPEFKTYMLMENIRLRDPDETDNENTFNVNMAHELCIPDSDTALASLINFIYDQKTLQMPTPKDLQKKVIVYPKNENVDMINAHVLSLVNRQQHVYLSLDEAMPHGNDGGEKELLYPPEYLNSLLLLLLTTVYGPARICSYFIVSLSPQTRLSIGSYQQMQNDNGNGTKPTDKPIGTNIGLPLQNTTAEVTPRIEDDIVDPYTLQPCDLLEMITDRQRPIIYDDQSCYPKHQTTKRRRNPHWYRSHLDPVGTQYLGGESISISNKYNHLGQCTNVCRHCGAMFWECEKVASASYGANFAYNKCCYGGRVILRPPPEYPQHIKELYESTHFMDNIRAYNQMFSMTSLGANVDNSVNNGKESNAHFGNEHKSELKEEIVERLIEFLDNHNALVQLFRTARNKYLDADIPEFKVRLYNVIGTRRYELSTSETVGAIVFAESSGTENEFDLIIDEHSRFPQRVNKLHLCYMSLQFPLLFLYGEDGYQHDIKLANVPRQSTRANKRMSMNMYYSYQIHDHLNHYNLLLRGGKLFQHYVMFAYCPIEQCRLDYIRQKQDDIRSEYLSGIYDAILRGDRDGSDLGLCTVLPLLLAARDIFLYTIEFQKRGLPHCHSLLWIDAASRVQQDVDVDKYVCAELPDPTTDTNAFAIISELMIHGPCGYANPNATCMKDGSSCNRNFPKPYCDKTYIDKDGFVHYRRKDTEIQTQRQNIWLDNRYVVPYNRTLCMRYYAHINVEYCGWTMLIKYLFKYISKGTDRVIANVTRPLPDAPSTSNAPAIQIDEIKNYVEARYIGPLKQVGILFSYTLSQPSCSNFGDIRKINNKIYPTNKAACQALGLLSGDEEWVTAFQEASLRLFVYILIFCNVSDPMKLWHKLWKDLSDDIPRKLSKTLRIPQIERNEKKLKASVLFDLEHMLNAYSKSLKDFGLPMPPEDMLLILQNRLLMEETNYDQELLLQEKNFLLPRLNKEQRLIFDEITNAIRSNTQRLIFVYGHGGTGKTFLWKAVTCLLRSEEKIVLTVAASGIAALLLPSGRTAHSRFQIPLNLKDECVCHIKKNSQLADLLRQTDLIIWDEAPMNDRRCFEALDRSLRDISNSPNTLFGGKSIMLGGDFRQTLPVKKKASKPEILDASITSSYLWPEFKTYMLMENMRLRQSKTTEAERLHIENFSSWLLSIGDGTIGDPDETDNENTFNVNMAHELCIPDSDTALASLINFIYDQKTLQMPTPKDLQKKVIVCPKNENADMINAQVLSLVNRQQHVYLSLDEVMPHGNDGGETELLYPPEYLNSLNFAGFPPHRLELKVGAPIILLRNLNISGGLCNGTRLIVTQLLNKVIEARIITGTRITDKDIPSHAFP
ncbi:DNA helicase [Tanacetum coccineum]